MSNSQLNLCDPGQLRRLLGEFGLAPKKGYGQNFLTNSAIPARIADAAADGNDEGVLEIGPGVGAMTRELSARFQKVVAVEIDRGLLPLLNVTLADCENTIVISDDFMQLDLRALLHTQFPGRRVSVCANLPYYITTPILMKLLEDITPPPFVSVTVMVQTEVADRMCAMPGSSDYGAITAAIAYYGLARKLFSVSPGCFYPAPKISSSVVKIALYGEEKYPSLDRALVFGVVKAAFAQRRKTLVNALAAAYASVPKAELEGMLVSLGHRTDIRGERLGIAEFRDIADHLYPLLHR